MSIIGKTRKSSFTGGRIPPGEGSASGVPFGLYWCVDRGRQQQTSNHGSQVRPARTTQQPDF